MVCSLQGLAMLIFFEFIEWVRLESLEHIALSSNYRIKTFLQLFILGEMSPYAYPLKKAFAQMGIVHFLVLSGAHVNAFVGIFRRLARLAFFYISSQPIRFFLIYCVCTITALFYGTLLGWKAPVSRALIFFMLRLFLPRLHLFSIVLLALLLHAGIFPEHLNSLSFYFSWLASLTLLLLSLVNLSQWSRLIYLCLICQLYSFYFFGVAENIFYYSLLALLANLFMAVLCQSVLFPLSVAFLLLVVCKAFLNPLGAKLLDLVLDHFVLKILHTVLSFFINFVRL